MSTDPMTTIWDALTNAGCEPQGETHKFSAYCPAHGGRSHRNLDVTEGSDRRVLMNCHAGCDWRAITGALGLDGRALFPPGHRNGRRDRPQRNVKPLPLSPGCEFLNALTTAGFVWKAHLLGTRCPYCDNPHAYLTVHDSGGLDVDCPDGCITDEVRRAVETRAAIAEKGLAL
jgi:hypothetical protein